MKYKVIVDGKPIRLSRRTFQCFDEKTEKRDVFQTANLDWAYLEATRVQGTVVDEDGKPAPMIRHMSKYTFEGYDYQGVVCRKCTIQPCVCKGGDVK